VIAPSLSPFDVPLEERGTAMRALAAHPAVGRLGVGVPAWDAEIWRAGRRWWRQHAAAVDALALGGPSLAGSGGDVYLATELYEDGGHTGLIGDCVRALDAPAHVVLTDLHGGHRDGVSPRIVERLGVEPAAVSVLSGPGLDARGRELFVTLRALRPRRLLLFHHPHDPLAVLAAQPEVAPAAWLVHHADATPSFGLHVPGVRVIELHEPGVALSQLLGRLPFLLPLTAPDPGPRPFAFLARGRIVTASCGIAWKFAPAAAYDYAETVAELLGATGGWHVHVGAMDEALRARLYAALASRGVAAERLEHVAWTSSLARTLWERRCDVYVASFPADGARARVDALASGTPYLWHATRPDGDRPDRDSTDDRGGLAWRTWAELRATLAGLADPEALATHGARARGAYDAVHHPAVFARTLRAIVDGTAAPAPLDLDRALGHALRAVLGSATGAQAAEAALAGRVAALDADAGTLRARVEQLRAAVDAHAARADALAQALGEAGARTATAALEAATARDRLASLEARVQALADARLAARLRRWWKRAGRRRP
jgi:hypothetical protein